MNTTLKHLGKLPLKDAIKRESFRYKSYVAVEIDVPVKNTQQNLKPRKHPGILRYNNIELPTHVRKAFPKIVGDYPKKTLLEDCKKLNNFIQSRHPPPEASKTKLKLKKIIEEVNASSQPEQPLNDDQDKSRRFEQRRYQIIKRKMSERIYAWKPITYGQYEALTYAIGRGALEYAVLRRIMQEILTRDVLFKPQSYFDFGSGVGTGMWASSSIWKDSIYEYYNVDNSRSMNELSELLLSEGNENQDMSLRNVFYRQYLPAMETKYDLVICAYTLFELPDSKTRKETILNLWKRCDGYLIVVEEGTRRGTELINECRDHILLSTAPHLVGHVFAPCPHAQPCPRLADANDQTPCNFEISYMDPQLNKPTNARKSARYTYIVLKKGLPQDTNLAWPRIVRPTLVRSKHVICRMCTSNGKLQEVIFTKSKHGRFAYACAKASLWGDRLPVVIKEASAT